MNKKAVEVAPGPLIVGFAILLIVLIVLLFIFARGSGSFGDFIKDTWVKITRDFDEDSKIAICENPIFQRQCGSCNPGYISKPVPIPVGKEYWADLEGDPCNCVQCISS